MRRTTGCGVGDAKRTDRRRRAEHHRDPGDRAGGRGVGGPPGFVRERGARDPQEKRDRCRRQRHPDARPFGGRIAPGSQKDRARHRVRHDHGLREHRDRHRGGAAWGLRLRHQALPARRYPLRGAPRAQGAAPAATRRSPLPRGHGGGAGAEPVPGAAGEPRGRPQPAHGGGLPHHRDGGDGGQHHPDHGGERHGEGTGRAGDPRGLAAEGEALRVDQLQRLSRDPARIGAVRLHERGVHRRGQ